MALSSSQKKMLWVGVPVVIGLALIFLLRNKSSSSTTATTTTPDNTALGVDQLTSFENAVQAQFQTIGADLAALQNGLTPTPPGGGTYQSQPDAAPPAAPTPSVAWPTNQLPYTPVNAAPTTPIPAAVAAAAPSSPSGAWGSSLPGGSTWEVVNGNWYNYATGATAGPVS